VGHHDCSTRARPDRIPTTAGRLTPAWLTEVLQPLATPAPEGPARVTTVEAAPLGVGLGLVGSLHRLDLTWTAGEGPQRLVAKLPARGMQTRAVASGLDMYRNEVRFYRRLAGDTALAITCHHADVDDRTHDFVLILDDMSSAAVVDQLAGCPHDRAVEVVVALADHHAGFWNETGLDGEPWLRRLADARLVDPFVAAFRATWPLVRSRFAHDLDERIVTLGDRFADLMPALAADLSQPPCTLSHGDFRLDNMFFCRPGRVRLCDWQLTDRSRGPRDLAYFLTQSLTPAARAEWERPLVDLYLERLAHQGVAGYDAAQAWHDYRVATVLAFAYPVVAGGGLDLDDPRGLALTRAMLDRSAAAILDHDGISLG
jgi:hypothetical protein